MHTKISPENPYGYSRYGFAWEHVPVGGDGHLDFGCHDGVFLNKLKLKKTGRLVGVDVSEKAVEEGRQRFPELEIMKVNEASTLPFNNATFGSVTVLEVLEHVYNQTELLADLNRILIDGGKLIVTVPRQHLFSFLDRGNFKFLFPRLHWWYYCFKHSREEYEYRYVSNPDGLVGDVSAKKRWHEHFSKDKLGKMLAEAGFNVIDFDGTGFFNRPISFVNFLFLRWFKPLQTFIGKILALDAKLFESANLFCVAEKCRST